VGLGLPQSDRCSKRSISTRAIQTRTLKLIEPLTCVVVCCDISSASHAGSATFPMSAACCMLPATYYLLSLVCFLLPVACCLLCSLLSASYSLMASLMPAVLDVTEATSPCVVAVPKARGNGKPLSRLIPLHCFNLHTLPVSHKWPTSASKRRYRRESG
jgi:hypothetical protein